MQFYNYIIVLCSRICSLKEDNQFCYGKLHYIEIVRGTHFDLKIPCSCNQIYLFCIKLSLVFPGVFFTIPSCQEFWTKVKFFHQTYFIKTCFANCSCYCCITLYNDFDFHCWLLWPNIAYPFQFLIMIFTSLLTHS